MDRANPGQHTARKERPFHRLDEGFVIPCPMSMNGSKTAVNTQKCFVFALKRSYSGSSCCFCARQDVLCEAGGKWCVLFPSYR